MLLTAEGLSSVPGQGTRIPRATAIKRKKVNQVTSCLQGIQMVVNWETVKYFMLSYDKSQYIMMFCSKRGNYLFFLIEVLLTYYVISFCCTGKQFTYIYILSFIFFHYRLS